MSVTAFSCTCLKKTKLNLKLHHTNGSTRHDKKTFDFCVKHTGESTCGVHTRFVLKGSTSFSSGVQEEVSRSVQGETFETYVFFNSDSHSHHLYDIYIYNYSLYLHLLIHILLTQAIIHIAHSSYYAHSQITLESQAIEDTR